MDHETNWRDRVDALIQAARDVCATEQLRQRAESLPQSHYELFDEYVFELRRAIRGSEIWWNAMVKRQSALGLTPAKAEREVRRLSPVGRVGDRAVIATVRKYWLACDALNREMVADLGVPPAEFVLASLMAASYSDMARFLSDFPYWPIGIDAEGNWV